ncbi:TPA: restriction endonuclease subunit S [Legionella pneumophila]
MSSKICNKVKPAILPKIRFPNFQDASEWEKKRLDEVARFVNERLPLEELSVTNYISTENILPNFRGITTSAKLPTTTTATKFKANDILISNIRPYLKKIWLSDKNGGASNDVIVLRCKEKIVTNFLSSVLKSDVFINYVMKGAKGVKMPRGDLSLIKEYLIAYPVDKKEQQKIADCLSSIDELITAENKKLDTLKIYKKGLMQQLFPAEGETLPKLRFPAFKDSGSWTKTRVIDLTNSEVKWSFTGGPFGSNLKSSDYTNSGIRVIQLQNIGDGEFIDNYKIYTSENKANELLSCNIYPNEIILSKMGDPVARACLIPDKEKRYLMCSDGIRLAVDKNKFDNYFIYSFINSEIFRSIAEKSSTGSTRKRIGLDILKNLKIMIPPIVEQQKIADLLSSLDDSITNQSKKMEALKQHKKGLMQKLFPIMSELQE